jgi:hypothetical protein
MSLNGVRQLQPITTAFEPGLHVVLRRRMRQVTCRGRRWLPARSADKEAAADRIAVCS